MCIDEFVQAKTFGDLIELSGNDRFKAYSFLANAFDGNNFTEGFINFCKGSQIDTNNLDITSLTGDKATQMAQAFLDYYYYSHPDVNATIRTDVNTDATRLFKYPSIIDREQGKRHVADKILKAYLAYTEAGFDQKTNKLKLFTDIAVDQWNREILAYASSISGRKLTEITDEYNALIAKNKEDAAFFLDGLLGGTEKTIVGQNLFAVWQELNGSPQVVRRYMEEVYCNQKLQYIRSEEDDYDALESKLQENANSILNKTANGEDGGVSSDDVDVDRSFTMYNSHTGEFTTFMMHISERLYNYFNSMDKLLTSNTDGVYNLDTNNRFGIAETLDANTVSSVLYSISHNFVNTKAMEAAIRDIAHNVPGFEGLVQLADTIKNDADFAMELMSVFAKTVTTKSQLRVNGRVVEVVEANPNADANKVMRYNLYSDLRGTLPNIDTEYANTLQKELDTEYYAITNYADSDAVLANEYLAKAKENIIKLAKLYCPSLEESAILTYINLNNDAGSKIKLQAQNINSLKGILSSITKSAQTVKKNYTNLEIDKREARQKNAYLRQLQRQGQRVESYKFVPLELLYAQDILDSSSRGAADDLVAELQPYTAVRLQLNSPNVNGNNSSDVLNNNYITHIKKIFEYSTRENVVDANGVTRTVVRNPGLEAWGKEKLRDNSAQYRYSSILLEQRDANGVISPGIFAYDVNGELYITDDAEELLTTSLFDGSSFFDEGKNAQYDEMVQTGYLPTAYMAFHHPKAVDQHRFQLANYFCRTPSDAPKNFLIRSIKHNTLDLIIESDPKYREREATQILTELPKVSQKDLTTIYNAVPYTTIAGNNIPAYIDLADKITGKKRKEIYLDYENQVVKINDDLDAVVYTVADAAGNIDYHVFTGKKFYTKNNGIGFRIQNYEGYYTGRIKKDKNGNPTNVVEYRETYGFPNYIVPRENGADAFSFKDTVKQQYEEILSRRAVTIHNANSHGEIKDKVHEAVAYKVNTQANSFKILKNIFKGEMLNMAIALDHYFEMDNDGWIIDGDRKQESSEKVIKLKNNAKDANKQGYNFYHLDKNGNVLKTEAKGGSTKYSLGGNVFHSTKFTLSITDDNGNVTKKNYMDKLITTDFVGSNEESNAVFHIFYGGGNVPVEQQQFLHVKRAEPESNDQKSKGNIIDVEFTQEQDAAVDAALSEFIIDYLDQAQKEIDNKATYIKHTDRSKTATTSFAINYFIFYNNSDDLFEGDIKFYKDAQTVLKRAKEIQGSGIPYGIVDYLNPESNTIEEVDGYLNDGVYIEYKDGENGREIDKLTHVQNLFNGTILEGVRQRSGFKAVTIKNTKMTNHDALERLAKALMRAGLDETRAYELLYGPIQRDKKGNILRDKQGHIIYNRGGFTDTKVNDAQSYITIQEFVRRVAAKGQLKRYIPLIQKLVDDSYVNNKTGKKVTYEYYSKLTKAQQAEYSESSPLTAKDLKEFVQVQKNFYYDQHFDERYNIHVPRQIKNAEFVLVPRLIRGTELETVYKHMIDKGIDQLNTVETSKAANEELITIWDNDGKFNISDFDNKADRLSQVYNYSFLYTQQETPQHVNSQNKAGIQIVKKIIDNITKDNKLYADKVEYFKLFVENIRESYNNLLDELNVIRDSDGNIDITKLNQLDKEMFFKKFKQELLRTGVDRNMLDFVNLLDGEPIMPAYFNNVINKLEQVAQSMFNNGITRQKLPGFHSAQVTNVGWSPLSDRYKSASYCKDLEYHPVQYEKISDSSKKISKRRYERLSEEDKKLYRQSEDPAGYIEVVVTWSSLGIDRYSEYYRNKTDQEILDELEDDGLDMIIGYRIPTEGKQSVCNMKIVGFISDACGSTIIVPNDWVSQTGSDFDIDSVYAITHETYKDKDGRFRPVKYIEHATRNDYIRYINHLAWENTLDEESKSDINKAAKELREVNNALWKRLHQLENEAYKKLTNDTKKQFMADSAAARAITKRDNLSDKEAYNLNLNSWINTLEDLDDTKEPNRKKFIAIAKAIQILVNNNEDEIDLEEVYKEVPELKVYIDGFVKSWENVLKKYNMPLEKDYLETFNSNPQRNNSRRARNNRILDIMIKILNDPSSLEENLSRSNFDDIIYWRDKIMSKATKDERDNRSAYNIFDQTKFQEDASSGMTLKGMSVAMDTFCSVCNTVQPMLYSPIKIIYNSEDYSEDANKIIDRFGDESFVSKDGKTFTVYHKKYGWSDDNRNVAGKILTAYSSQTTAHILDAIKEGAIPGVNQYTFPVYKTFVNIGADYKAAISFIMQPAVQRIIANQEEHTSVFASGYGNPIHKTIREILRKDLGLKADTKTNILTLLSELRMKTIEGTNLTYGEVFEQVWSESDNARSGISMNSNLPLDVANMVRRVKGEPIQIRVETATSSPVEGSNEAKSTKDTKPVDINAIRNAMFDLGIVIAFNNLQSTASKVSSIARCCNPDKFGAKQTVFATDKVFDDIVDIMISKEKDRERRSTLYVPDPDHPNSKGEPGKKHILEAIYPGLEDAISIEEVDGAEVIKVGEIIPAMNKHQIEDSAYPTLYAYLRYSSASASTINKSIFATQGPIFTAAVKGITSVFSGNKPRIDEETYKDFRMYMLTKIYQDSKFIQYPISVVYGKNGELELVGKPKTDDDKKLGASVKANPELIEQEKRRILGYGYPPSLKTVSTTKDAQGNTEYHYNDIVISDLNHPSDNDLKLFAKLTPAQKILYIKTNFRNAGFFNMLDVDLYNSGKRGKKRGTHSIEFKDDNYNIDVVRDGFYNMFYNTNPLVKMAAIDIIKYAVVAEGLKMQNKGVTKVLDNRVLNSPYGNDGTGFVAEVKHVVDAINTPGTIINEFDMDSTYENYLRSHKEVKGVRTLYINDENLKKYRLQIDSKNMIHLTPDAFDITEDMGPDKIATLETERRNEFLERMDGACIVYPYAKGYRANQYIRVKEKQNSTLYKIVANSDLTDIILYPLNNLETYENSEWSINPDNNIYPSQAFFQRVIKEYNDSKDKLQLSTIFEAEAAKVKNLPHADTYFYESPIDPNLPIEAKPFSLQDLASKGGEFAQIYGNIVKHFKNVTSEPLYINSNGLRDYIFVASPGYGSPQTIDHTDEDGRLYKNVVIDKVNTNTYNELYLRKNRKKDYYMDDATFEKHVTENVEDEVIRQALRDARTAKLSSLETLFVVTPRVSNSHLYEEQAEEQTKENDDFLGAVENVSNDEVRYSGVAPRIMSRPIAYMRSQQKKGEKVAIEGSEKLRLAGVTDSADSIEANKEEASKVLAKYASTKARELRNKFDSFCDHPSTPDTKISILDPMVQDILMSKVPSMQNQRLTLLNDYMKLMNEIDAFKKTFVGYENVNKDGMTDAQRWYVEQVEAALDKVNKIEVNDAIRKLNEGYLSAISGNPLIKEQALNIMDSFWKTYGGMWRFLDIAENGNPLLQVVLKDVMGNIEAQRQQTDKYRRDFLKAVAKIKRAAREEGLSIDFNKFIDKDGRLIQDYANEFVDKLYDLRDARNEAARIYGYGSIQHLKAKQTYDVFKAKHIQQPVKQEYYIKYLNNIELMLRNYPEIYSAYMTLYYERLDIIGNMSEEGLSELESKRVNEIDREIQRLTSKNGFYDDNGDYHSRPHYTPPTNNLINNASGSVTDLEEDDANRYEDLYNSFEDYEDNDSSIGYDPAIYGDLPASALSNFLTAQKKLNDTYWQYDSIYGFDDQLRLQLNIIAAAEERDANGIPTKTQYDLQNNQRYQDAREWVAKNAKFVIEPDEQGRTNPNSFYNRLNRAFDVLEMGGNRKQHVSNEIIKDKNIRDYKGVPDARLLSEDDIRRIKEAQQNHYQVRGLPEGTDRVLISSAQKDDNLYSKDFWKNLKLNGNQNGEYLEIVTKINAINEKYYDNIDGIIHYDRIQDNEEGINELRTLANLYQQLRQLSRYEGSTNGSAVKEFMETQCEDTTNISAYRAQKREALNNKSNAYKEAWIHVNAELNSDGTFVVDENGNETPNRFIYRSFKPVNPEMWKADEAMQDAINLITNSYRRVPTIYWHMKFVEMQQLRETNPQEYEKWWIAQHVWNPYNREYELLDCWVTTELKQEFFTNGEFRGKWEPKANQRVRVPRDGTVILNDGRRTRVASRDMRNPDYNEDVDMLGNYIKGSENGLYDSHANLNEYEIKMRDLFQSTLQNLATTEQAKRHFSKGFLPRRMKKKENLLNRTAKEAGKLVGLAFESKERNREMYNDIDYWKDRTPLAPMTAILSDEKLGSQKFTQREPLRKDYANTPEGAQQYETEHQQWQHAKKDVEDKNNEVNRALLDRDWVSVMEEFITRAGRYNSILDNKEKLYYLLNQLREQRAYERQHGLYGDLAEEKGSTEDNPTYTQSQDTDLIENYTNFMRRLLFDQWKNDDGIMTTFAKHLQGYTSADYMMLNYRGGIANITVGEAGILAEVAAGEYIDRKSWAFGTAEWVSGCVGYFRGMYDEIAYNKQDAIIKRFKVVDYDEVVGANNELDLDKYSRRVRDFMFHPQTVGEHFMQNSVLFAMLKSHKLINIENDPTGIGVTYMNKEEYVRYREATELEDLLSDRQKAKFNEFKAEILKDANKTKDYAWWRKDFLTEFIYIWCSKEAKNAEQDEEVTMTDKARREFLNNREQNRKRYIEEFNAKKDMYSQLELGADGYMSFVEGSDFAKLDERLTDDGKMSKATALCGNFTERVRKVNNKIHGVYNKMGQAYVERYWFGGLLMQYHKHLPMGIVKHFRARGYYNETRGTVEKGMAQSLIDFVNLDMRKVAADAGWNRDECNAMQALQFHLKHSFDYLCQIRDTWAVIPEYERDNIRRNLSDLLGTIAGVVGVIGLKAYAGDDDDDSGLLYNIALYECDRLASEVFLYNPIGLWTESKSLMSTPVAAESIIQDGINSIINITSWLLNPDDTNLYYQSGRFAGRNKLSVYLERRIPIYNGIRGFFDTPANNHYYKIGSKTGSIASTVSHWVLDEDN